MSKKNVEKNIVETIMSKKNVEFQKFIVNVNEMAYNLLKSLNKSWRVRTNIEANIEKWGVSKGKQIKIKRGNDLV